MSAPWRITGKPLDWRDLLGIARQHPQWATSAIEHLRDEAQAKVGKGHCSGPICKAIADACQGYLDCECDDCLDEIEALMADDEPQDDPAWSYADYARDMREIAGGWQ